MSLYDNDYDRDEDPRPLEREEQEMCEMSSAADKAGATIYHGQDTCKKVIKAIKQIEENGQIAYVRVTALPWDWREVK